MASAKDFARLEQINGISHAILVRNNGQVLSQASDITAVYAPLIAGSGIRCDSLSTDMGGSRYIHFCLEQESGQNVLVFPLGQFYLGIITHPNCERQEIIDQVVLFLKHLK